MCNLYRIVCLPVYPFFKEEERRQSLGSSQSCDEFSGTACILTQMQPLYKHGNYTGAHDTFQSTSISSKTG